MLVEYRGEDEVRSSRCLLIIGMRLSENNSKYAHNNESTTIRRNITKLIFHFRGSLATELNKMITGKMFLQTKHFLKHSTLAAILKKTNSLNGPHIFI